VNQPVNKIWAEALVDELVRCGIEHVCVSPGSRSTPLVCAFDDHPAVTDISIIDERSSAFYALGLAQSTGRPVALVCTSGTAAANWMPAVCEADRARVPLLLLTADRPAQLRDTGSPQSMDQLKLYGDRVRWFHEFERPEPEEDLFRYLCSTVDLAWERAQSPTPGPVHLNCPFRKPLEPLAVDSDHRDAVPERFEPPQRSDGGPFTRFTSGEPTPSAESVDKFVELLAGAERPLFFCGADRRGGRYRGALRDLAEAAGAPVVAEPTSQLRFWPDRGDGVFGTGDYLLDATLPDPDLVVRTGEAPLTWVGRELSGRLEGVGQVTVHPYVERRDPDHVVGWHLGVDERRLFEPAAGRIEAGEVDMAWLEQFRRDDRVARRALDAAVEETSDLEEPRLWWELQELLPAGAALFVSNSMPVRNLDMYAPGGDRAVDVYFNRGLNGIDGIESTGLGVARGADGPTVVVTGDVAFRHDVGGLATARRTGADITFIVVDNGGGAIFDQLPISECGEVHERHFVTEPEVDVAGVAEGFGLPVAIPEDWTAVRRDVAASIEAPGTQLVWLRTDRQRDKERGEAIRRRVVEAIEEGR
jgi:2-succinyl-5-enolpyruvyl-6-hydroxy-3-cyclohexene-1-carboxylate synthase